MNEPPDVLYQEVTRLVDEVERWLNQALRPPEPVTRAGDWQLRLGESEGRPAANLYIAVGGFTAWMQDSAAVDEVEFDFAGGRLSESLLKELGAVLTADLVEEVLLPGLLNRRRQRLVEQGATPRQGRIVNEVRRWTGRTLARG